MKQQTLQGSFTLKGVGLHTGLEIVVTFNPAPENHGVKIKRVDLEDQPILDALAENVVNTQRGTVIGKDGVTVSTIEHGMAALYALGIDNCLIEVDASEFPILDGSSIEYVKEINKQLKYIKKVYRKYPKFIDIIANRHNVYNETLEYIRKQEAEGKLFVIRPPEKIHVKGIGDDAKTLTEAYNMGRDTALKCINDLKNFLGV